MDSPLSGVKVLDLTRYLSGPYATLLLAEMGADVVKIEVPGKGDDTRRISPLQGGISYYHSSVNRSKDSVEVDLKSEDGLKTVLAMLPDYDVLIENFRPGVAERLGLGYEAVAAANPRLVYCSISGFGAKGPRSRRAAFDLIVQGESGIMSLNGDGTQPPSKLGLPVADISAGMFAVQGVLAALLRRGRTGSGGLVEVSMLNSLLSMSAYNPTLYFMSGKTPTRVGSRHPGVVPYGPYPTADGTVLLSTFSDDSWRRIVEAFDRGDLSDDPRFTTAPARVVHRDACDALITEILSGFTSEDVVQRLGKAGIPCGVVRDFGEVLEIEHATGTGTIAEVEYPGEAGVIKGVRIPVKFDGEWCPTQPAPELGQSNALLDRYRPTPAAAAEDLRDGVSVGVRTGG